MCLKLNLGQILVPYIHVIEHHLKNSPAQGTFDQEIRALCILIMHLINVLICIWKSQGAYHCFSHYSHK